MKFHEFSSKSGFRHLARNVVIPKEFQWFRASEEPRRPFGRLRTASDGPGRLRLSVRAWVCRCEWSPSFTPIRSGTSARVRPSVPMVGRVARMGGAMGTSASPRDWPGQTGQAKSPASARTRSAFVLGARSATSDTTRLPNATVKTSSHTATPRLLPPPRPAAFTARPAFRRWRPPPGTRCRRGPRERLRR